MSPNRIKPPKDLHIEAIKKVREELGRIEREGRAFMLLSFNEENGDKGVSCVGLTTKAQKEVMVKAVTCTMETNPIEDLLREVLGKIESKRNSEKCPICGEKH